MNWPILFRRQFYFYKLGKPSVEIPMERNQYATDLPFSDIFAIYLKIQSQAFMQILNISYEKIAVAAKENTT